MTTTKAATPTAPWRSRIVGSGDEAPDQLLANPGNWRTHPANQRAALRGSLDTVGWVQQVMVNRRTGFVVDGHARVALAISRNEPSVPVLYVDLSPEEEALVLATLDPIGAMATAASHRHYEPIVSSPPTNRRPWPSTTTRASKTTNATAAKTLIASSGPKSPPGTPPTRGPAFGRRSSRPRVTLTPWPRGLAPLAATQPHSKPDRRPPDRRTPGASWR